MVTLGALNAFRTAAIWADNAKLNLDGQGGVGNAGNYGGFLSARNREQTERDANNAVRTELLKALARTFDIATTDRPANGTHFSQKFMQKLETLLGPAFRRDDFKVGEDGVVSSGRPLTARRIKAILQSAQDAANTSRYNDTIMINLRTDTDKLPDEFKGVVAHAYGVVEDRFGALGTPPVDELHTLVDGSYVGEIFDRFKGKRVTPAAIRDVYSKFAVEEGALRLAKNKTQQIIEAHGGEGNVHAVFRHVNNRHPEILRAIIKAKTPAAAEAAFDRFAQVVEADYERFRICNHEIRDFNFKAQNILARRLGIPVQNLVGIMDQLATKKFGERLLNDILDGKDPADGANAIKAAFDNHAERFSAGYANALAGVDGLNIPASAKDRMKIHILKCNNVSYLNFERIFQIGANLQAGTLKELLDANAPKEDVYNEMASLARAISNPVNEMFDAARAAGKDIGPDELSNASNLVMEVLFGNNPGLRDQIAAFLNRPDVQVDQGVGPHAFVLMQFSEPIGFIPPAKDHILEDLGTAQLNPIYAQSLVSAARELGRNDPPDAVLALFAAGTPAGDLLREALGQFEGELDTTTLKAFAIGVLQRQ